MPASDPVQVISELVNRVIPHVSRDIGYPWSNQRGVDYAISLFLETVRVCIYEEVFAVALNAETHAVNHVALDGPIHRVGRYIRRGRRVNVSAIGADKIKRTVRVGRRAFGEVATAQVPGTMPGHCWADLVIQTQCGIVLGGVQTLVPLQVLHEFGSDPGNRHKRRPLLCRIDLVQNARDGWINRTGERARRTRVSGHLQQIHSVLDVVSAEVSEVTLLRGSGEDWRRQCLRGGLRLNFIVSKEEQLTFEAMNKRQQRAADRAHDVVISYLVAWQALQVAEEPVGVEPFVLSLIEDLAMVLVGAALRRQANLHSTFTPGVGA